MVHVDNMIIIFSSNTDQGLIPRDLEEFSFLEQKIHKLWYSRVFF